MVKDKFGNVIHKGNKVKFLDKKYRVDMCEGSLGIASDTEINYDKIEKVLLKEVGRVSWEGCRIDHFISFLEIRWNFDYDDVFLEHVEVVE